MTKQSALPALLLLFSINLYCQEIIKIEPIQIPPNHLDVYYINTKPILKNGQLFTGIDTSTYTENGEKLLVVRTYKNGFKTELKTFFDNGNLETFWQWENGKRNGVSKRNYKSGKTMFDYIMKDGKGVGANVTYYESGDPKYITDDNLRWSVYFFENGKTKSITHYILDSAKCMSTEGYEITEWQENGQLYRKATYNCGCQNYKFYHNDSVIAVEGINCTSFGFLFSGKYTERYKNGKLKIEGIYNESKPGVKNGTWKYYDENGKLILEEFYENDLLKKATPSKIKNKPAPFFERN